MISYNDIYEASRKERYTDQLQLLPKNFLVNIIEYLDDKKKMAKDEQSPGEAIKIDKQIENANTLFRELLLRRRKKILHIVLIASETGISKQDFDNMLPFEKDLFEEIMKCIDLSDQKFSETLKSDASGEMSLHELILFKEDVEEFMDLDESKLGPFEKGQIANISKGIAKILIDAGKADVVNI